MLMQGPLINDHDSVPERETNLIRLFSSELLVSSFASVLWPDAAGQRFTRNFGFKSKKKNLFVEQCREPFWSLTEMAWCKHGD